MPKLQYFLACNSAMAELLTGNNFSLIAIIDVMNAFRITPNSNLPSGVEDAALGILPISMISHWALDKSDEGKKFEQQVRVVAPDGREASVTEKVAFSFTSPFHRVIQRTSPILFRMVGMHIFRLLIREAGSDESNWSVASDYQVLIADPAGTVHRPVPVSNAGNQDKLCE